MLVEFISGFIIGVLLVLVAVTAAMILVAIADMIAGK